MTALPEPTAKKLGLVIDLDTCVGCHACATSCKEWNAGGIAGPLLFGVLISTGSRGDLAIGYVIGSALMLGAAAVEALWGVAAERKSLETVAQPLALVD